MAYIGKPNGANRKKVTSIQEVALKKKYIPGVGKYKPDYDKIVRYFSTKRI